jgi:PKD repeat protein
MKQILLSLLFAFLCSVAFSQTFSPDFLDGHIMFQLKKSAPITKNVRQTDVNDYSLELNMDDFPEIKAIFAQANVQRFSLPSYFTHKAGLSNIYRIEFSDYSKIDALIKALQANPNVEYAEKEPIYKIDFVPNDTYHSGNNKWYHTLVGSEAAWDISTGSSTVKVAIVDNAVFANHLDLTTFLQRDVADNDNDATPPLDANADFGWSHGTHCAGLATADINNNRGIASLGGNVELIGVKATPNSGTSGSVYYGYNGVQWACQNGADVVSMSFGGPSASTAMQNLINAYPDVVFLAAAGNDGATALMYPGAYNNVICVGSVNSTGNRSSFSNYNGATPFVDIAAPGGYSFGGLYSTVYTAGGNSYGQMGGTSMATPFAAGLVGLMLSVNPAMSPGAIEACLISTGVNNTQNIGPRISALAALQCVQSTLTGDPIPYFTGSPLSLIEGETCAFIDASSDGGSFPITNWTWSFPGGTPSSFVGQNPPLITYNTAGAYDVTLTVTNSQSTQAYTRTAYVNVSIPPYGEWLPQASGFTTANRGITDISIVDQNIVWATAYDGTGGAANIQQFTKTSNGGTSWAPGAINLGNAALGISMIHGISATTAWVAAYPNAAGQTGGIWKTTNGGAAWTRQNTAVYNNAASFTNIVHFWDANEGFCQGDPINGEFEIYRTMNGGTTWTLVTGANIPNPLNGNEFGYTNQYDVVGDNVWFTTSVGRIYHSQNRGATWAVYTSPIPDFGGAITTTSTGNLSYASPTEGVIVNQAGNVYKTTNAGSTWAQVTTTGSVFTNSICFIEGTNTVFSTGAGAGTSGSSYSADGGITWNLIDTEQHLNVEFINTSVGWSGWFNVSSTEAGMWKWNDLSSSLSGAFSASTINTCTNSAVNFTDNTTGGTPTTWDWAFIGGTPATSTAQNPSVTYATPGTYSVSLTVGDGSSQTTVTQNAYITVVAPTVQPSAISGLNVICVDGTGTYSVTNTPGVFYNWMLPAGWFGTSSTNSIFVTANNAGGTLSVSATNTCGASTPSTIAIAITVDPLASFTSSNSGPNYTFTSTSSNGTSWAWDFGDGNTSTLENPTHSYVANGNYTVTLVVTNPCSTSTSTSSVVISGVGIDEINQGELSIYPVPASDVVYLKVTDNLLGSAYTVTDVTGKVLMTGKIDALVSEINVIELSKGVYFVQLKKLNGTQRFIKQ